MIISGNKDKEELHGCLKRYNSFFLIGCTECASLCGRGNEEALQVKPCISGI